MAKEILVISSGLAPQVITEMLWWFAVSDDGPKTVPIEIHVVTTREGAQAISDAQLVGAEGRLAAFCREFELPDLNDRLRIEALQVDLQEVGANHAYGRHVARLLRDCTADPDTRVHTCLAGGYKTMSFYMGYSMSLLGRYQDRLYHVFVTPGFEGSPDFWWKPKVSREISIVLNGKRQTVRTDDAAIDVASIPFARLRYLLKKDDLDDAADFGTLVGAANEGIGRQMVSLFDESREVRIGDETKTLPPKQYALFRLLAECRKKCRKGAGPGGIGDDHEGWLTMDDVDDPRKPAVRRFLLIWEDLPGGRGGRDVRGRYEVIERTIRGEDQSVSDKEGKAKMKDDFSQNISKINSQLRQVRELCVGQKKDGKQPSRIDGKQPARFGLIADPNHIVLED